MCIFNKNIEREMREKKGKETSYSVYVSKNTKTNRKGRETSYSACVNKICISNVHYYQ